MASLKRKGDLAELKVATDLIDRGCQISIPFGEDCDYDLIADKGGELHRIQVKYTESDGSIVVVRCRSHSLTNGKVRQVKQYTAKTIDWIAVYDRTSDRCYYCPASELGNGRSHMSLRLTPALNGQRIGIRPAEDYLEPDFDRDTEMEPAGFEPATSRMQTGRSSS
jgi:PD-(D/E)XK endonuclease